MKEHKNIVHPTLEQILKVDSDINLKATSIVNQIKGGQIKW
jgi:hypothetical protein